MPLDNSKKELVELRCQERKLARQMELIKSALNELGCEEVPSGCDLSMENQSFIDNSSDRDHQVNNNFMFFYYIPKLFSQTEVHI